MIIIIILFHYTHIHTQTGGGAAAGGEGGGGLIADDIESPIPPISPCWRTAALQCGITQLIHAYQRYGHYEALLDPLNLQTRMYVCR